MVDAVIFINLLEQNLKDFTCIMGILFKIQCCDAQSLNANINTKKPYSNMSLTINTDDSLLSVLKTKLKYTFFFVCLFIAFRYSRNEGTYAYKILFHLFTYTPLSSLQSLPQLCA